MKKAIILLCAALFIAVGFSGCVLQIEKTTGTGDDGTGGLAQGNETSALKEGEMNDIMQPAAENNVLYMHIGDGDEWMNTMPRDPSASRSSTSPGYAGLANGVGAWFKLKPAPESDLLLNSQETAIANIRMKVETTSPQYSISTSLSINDIEYSSDERIAIFDSSEHVYSFVLDVPEKILQGSEVVFSIIVRPPGGLLFPGTMTATIYLEEASTLTLPITYPIKSQPASSSHSGSAQSSSGDRNAKIEESAVSASVGSDGKWHAAKTVTITNDFGDAEKCSLSFSTCNGGITASSNGESGYRIVASLEGKGTTRDEAIQNLNELEWDHTDSLSGSEISLGLSIASADWQDKCASIAASVPKSAEYSIESRTTNGGIESTGLHGSSFMAETTNGEVVCTGNFNNFDIEATNGEIDVKAASSASGTYNLDTTNGEITLSLKNTDEYGYDVSAQTTNGEVSIELSGTEPVGSQSKESKHVKTEGYDSKSIKVKVVVETTNGYVEVKEW
jgi:hypothetical protein